MTMTPMVHPKRLTTAVDALHYPYRVTVETMAKTGSYGAVEGLSDLPAAYKPDDGSAPEMFEGATGNDQILLMQAVPQIRPKMRVTLSLNGSVTGRFTVDDALPTALGTQTLLSVSPVM